MSTGKVTYRPPIDGLRAIAVIAVLVFHGFPKLLPSGFIGVDIFFVISGFLISRILYDEFADPQSKGIEVIGRFYARRIRRIFPALLVVLGPGAAPQAFAAATEGIWRRSGPSWLAQGFAKT